MDGNHLNLSVRFEQGPLFPPTTTLTVVNIPEFRLAVKCFHRPANVEPIADERHKRDRNTLLMKFHPTLGWELLRLKVSMRLKVEPSCLWKMFAFRPSVVGAH